MEFSKKNTSHKLTKYVDDTLPSQKMLEEIQKFKELVKKKGIVVPEKLDRMGFIEIFFPNKESSIYLYADYSDEVKITIRCSNSLKIILDNHGYKNHIKTIKLKNENILNEDFSDVIIEIMCLSIMYDIHENEKNNIFLEGK